MPFLSCHMQKVKRNAVVGLNNHIQRLKVSKTNPDINKEKTIENYTLVGDEKYLKKIDEVVSKASNKTIKKDAVVLSSFVVGCGSKDDHLDDKQQRAFFNDCVDWFGNRYGKDKMVYATVHLDEAGAGHLHLGIVPLTKDGRLCCKELFNPKEMQFIQDHLYHDVGERYGLSRGIKDSGKKHLSELEYKTMKEQQKLNQLIKASFKIREVDEHIMNLQFKKDPEQYKKQLLDLSKNIYKPSLEEYVEPFQSSIAAKHLKQYVFNGNQKQYNNYIKGLDAWHEVELDRLRKKKRLEEENELERDVDRDFER